MKEKNTENRKRKSFALLLGECAIIVFFGVYIYWQYLTPFPGLNPGVYFDALNLIPIIGMLLIVMAATGSLKELGYAFKYCFMPDSDFSDDQVGKAARAVKLAMITAVLTGGIVTLFNLITVFYTSINLFAIEDKLYEAGPGQILIASSMTSLLCGMLVAILLLPIYGRLKK